MKARFGEIVWGVDDLHQSISSLILTPLGSVPTEPEKGCDLLPYIDRSLDVAAHLHDCPDPYSQNVDLIEPLTLHILG